MRRFCGLLVLLLCLTGCGAGSGTSSETPSVTTTTSVSVTETQMTEMTTSTNAQPLSGTHVTDEIGVLSKAALDACDALAADLSDKYLLEIGVAVIGNLDGGSPAAFAKAAYEARFSPESTGFLILINNETGQDYIHRNGACSQHLTDAAVSLAIAQATPLLVEGDYAGGIQRLLALAEHMPTAILDRCQYLTAEQSTAFLEQANAAMPEDAMYSVLLTKASQNLQGDADAWQKRAGMKALLVIDVQTKETAIAGDFPNQQAQNAALTAVLQEAEELPVTQTIAAFYEAVKTANDQS